MLRRLIALNTVFTVIPCARAAAQAPASAALVRVWAVEPLVRAASGRVFDLSPDAVTITQRFPSPPIRIERKNIIRLEVRGPRSRAAGAVRGFLIGTALGAGIGILAAAPALSRTEPRGDEQEYAILTAAGMTLGGATFGLLLGTASPGEAWNCADGWPCEQPNLYEEFRRAKVSQKLGVRLAF